MADRDPEELETEIERTREELARTIDALAERVSPGNVVHRTGDRVREEISQIGSTLRAAVSPSGSEELSDQQRKAMLIGGGLVLATAALLFIRKRRRR